MNMLQNLSQARDWLVAQGDDFAVIDNPPGIFPERELVALAPVHTRLDGMPSAIFLDMDGTMTCTEPLFLHGVEAVVRRATGWHSDSAWAGLDAERDHPKIVGFSTLRNLEYLYTLHGEHVVPALFFEAVEAAMFFLADHQPPQDILDRIATHLENQDMGDWWAHALSPNPDPAVGARLRESYVARFPKIEMAQFAHFGLMVFYADYLDALMKVNRGDGAEVSMAVYGDPAVPAVAPMPGIALLCALAKGWLPPDSAAKIHAAHGYPPEEEGRFADLCRAFSDAPIPVALVTSSGAHETSLVLRAVFRAMREEVAGWGLAPEVRARIIEGVASPENYFDAIVTCDDVIEGRTKPFRDPYTTAMERLGLDFADAQRAIGFEDTEAGIIAQRGAGIGVPCALPIEFTAHQDFSAAAHVLHGGVLDAMLRHGMFMP